MYRTIIKLKDNTPASVAKEIREICIKAHHNYVGKIDIKDVSPIEYVFEAAEKDYNCLQYGSLCLDDIPVFKEWVKEWNWEDEDPNESCNLIEVFSKPIYS